MIIVLGCHQKHSISCSLCVNKQRFWVMGQSDSLILEAVGVSLAALALLPTKSTTVKWPVGLPWCNTNWYHPQTRWGNNMTVAADRPWCSMHSLSRGCLRHFMRAFCSYKSQWLFPDPEPFPPKLEEAEFSSVVSRGTALTGAKRQGSNWSRTQISLSVTHAKRQSHAAASCAT